MTKREIKIEQATFRRLGKHAETFESEDALINRILDAFEKQHPKPKPTPIEQRETFREIEVISEKSLPDLKHTKIIKALVDGIPIQKLAWRYVLDQVLISAEKKNYDISQIARWVSLNIVTGFRKGKGYTYIEDINISVQGMSANKTCQASIQVARKIGVEIDIRFQWNFKAKARRAGEFGHIKIDPAG